MSHITIGDDQAEEAILDCDISDAALETAAGVGQHMAAATLPNALLCIPFVAQRQVHLQDHALRQSVNS
jgi:hypothetical protein